MDARGGGGGGYKRNMHNAWRYQRQIHAMHVLWTCLQDNVLLIRNDNIIPTEYNKLSSEQLKIKLATLAARSVTDDDQLMCIYVPRAAANPNISGRIQNFEKGWGSDKKLVRFTPKKFNLDPVRW